MSIQKKNDWAVTLFFNPDKSLEDLANLGVNVNNSELKDKEYYKSYPEMQEYFSRDGKFNEVEFNNFYNSALSIYNSEAAKEVEANIVRNFTYDENDLLAPIGSPVRDSSPKIIRYSNPTRSSVSVSILGQLGAPTMSEREVAQTQKVYDPATKKFEDWTPNDLNIFSSMSAPTLVLAKWDEDGVHEENGMTVRHYKGQTKYNSNGDPYYEKLNGRSVDGREVLHASDILTIDGSKWNKYDFFDSDGLDKSVVGSIFNTVVKIAPAFIPYANIGTIYTAITSAIEVGKLLPILYKSIYGIATNNNDNSKSVKLANGMQGWLSKFDSSTSDRSRENFWNAENVLNIAASSGLQLKQQRLIGEIPRMIAGGKDNYNTIKWGRALSLSYMVGTSSTQSYEAFKDAGASDAVAGFGTLATMFAMKKLMDNDYFREFWYEGTPLSKHEYNKAIKSAADQVLKNIQIGTNPTQKQAAKWILDAEKLIVDSFNKINKTKILSGALNEGLEEMGEEFTSDMVKASMSALNYLGIVDKNRTYDFGTSLEDIASRYSAAFFGGGIGGAVFSLHDRIAGLNKNIAEKSGNDPWFKEMVYLARNGRGDEFRSQLKKRHQKGKLGSTSLSAIDYEFVEDENGISINYKSAKDGESHNDIVYNQVLNLFNRIEGILNEESLQISDEDLNLIRQANPELNDVDNEGVSWMWKNRVLDHRLDKIINDENIISKIYQDWNDLSQDILSTKLKMEEMLKPNQNEPKTPKDVDVHIAGTLKDPRYIELQQQLNSLRLKRDEILLGHKNDYYYGQMSFLLQPDLASIYGAPIGLDNFSKERYGKLYNELTLDEKSIVDRDFSEYTKLDERNKAYRAYDIFYNISERFSKKISDTAEKIAEYNSLFDNGDTEYSKNKIILTSLISNLISQLDQARKNSNLEKIPELEEKISKLQREFDNLEKAKDIQTTRRLSKKGDEILRRYDSGQELNPADKFTERINHYLIWLNYLKDNNLFIEPDDADLQNILIDTAASMESNESLFNDKLNEKILSLYGPGNDVVGDNLRDIRSAAISNLRKGDLVAFLNNISDANNDEFIEDPYTGEFDQELFDLIFGITSDGQKISDLIKKIQEIRSSLTVSPIYDLLKEIANDINPSLSNIVDMVLSDLRRLPYMDSLDDYVISDIHALDNLKLLREAIKVADSLIYAGNDINADMNKFRVNKELLTVITDPVREIAKSEFNNLYNKVSRLIDIAETNSRQKLREQKDIMFNMRKKFGDILTSKDSILKETFSKAFNIDIENLIHELELDTFEVTEDNYSKYESAIIKFEDAIYNEVRKANLSISDIINKITSLFNWKELLHRKPTKMVKDPSVIISDYDKMIYLISIIANPSSDFYNKFKKIISDQSFDKAPIFGQEYIAKIAYSFISYPELANELLSKLKVLANNNEDDSYLKNKPSLYNVMSIMSGGAGSGKTNGVDRIIYEMIKDESDVIVCAPTNRQANILSSALNFDGKTINKSELLNLIIGKEQLDQDDIILNKENGTFDVNPNIKVVKNNIFGTKQKKILFIDEYSLFSKPELQIISNWAVKNDVLIIFSGDQKQNKAAIKYQKDNVAKYALSGMEDFITISTPELSTSLRANNLAKLENYNSLNTVLTKAYDFYYSNPKSDSGELSGIIHKELDAHGITLKYYESDNTFGGEKFISENDIDSSINKLLSISDNIAVISDSPEKYSKYNVKIIDIKSVQGDEFDYVLIDKDWAYNAYGIKQDTFNRLSDLYALTQRSTEGTIIVDKSLQDLFLYNIQDNNSSGRIIMNNDSISSFKETRLNSLPNFTDSNIEKSKFKDANTIVNENSETESLEENKESNEDTQNAISSPLVNASISPALIDDNMYSIVDTIQGFDIKFHFDNMYNIFTRSLFKIDQLSSIRVDSKMKALYWGVSSYFKYGYYKISNEKPLYDYLYSELKSKKDANRIISAISNYKLSLIPYSQNGKNTSVLSAVIPFGNNQLIIPLMVTNKAVSETEVFDGDIRATFVNKYRDNISSNGTTNQFVYGATPGDSIFGYNFKIIGDPIILSKSDDKEFQDNISKERFYKDNVGKTMMVISSDPLSSMDDYRRFLTYDKDNLFTLHQDPRFRIIGVNKHATSANQLFELVSNLKGSENYNILSKNTLAKMLSLIYDIDKDLLIDKISKQIFVNHPDWYIKINGSNEVYKTYNDLINIDWNNLTSFEIFRDKNDVVYSIDNSLFIKEFMTKRFHDTTYADDSIIKCINDVINSQQFIHGIKLNDKLLYGSKVTEDSMWYNISSKNSVPYTTDIVEMYEPYFELIIKTKDSYTEDNVEQVENIDEITENNIDSKIRDFIGDSNAIIEFINNPDTDIWKKQLVFVTSQSNRILLSVYDNKIEIIKDVNIISNVEILKSYIESLSNIADARDLLYDVVRNYNNAINGLNVEYDSLDMIIDEWNYNGEDIVAALTELSLSSERLCIV